MQPLETVIRQKIEENHEKMPFSEFMHHALYTPNLGYYSSNRIKFGPEGDFTTAPEMSPLFAKTIANELSALIKNQTFDHVLEFGAGSGRLALDLLLELERLNALPKHYYILEVSAHLKALQIETIKDNAPHLLPLVTHLSSLPHQSSDNTIMIGNEVLDAMPVSRFRIHQGTLEEAYIGVDGDCLVEYFDTPTKPLKEALAPLLPLPETYTSEINLFVAPWLKALSQSFKRAVIFLFDYGFSTDEYYHPDRTTGTLMCHRQHQAHSDPLLHIGEQDITAHVDFGYLSYWADTLGFDVLGYTTLAGFVLGNNILELAESNTETEHFEATQAIKQFTMPQEMGELFKVIAFGLNYTGPLQGFSMRDLKRML